MLGYLILLFTAVPILELALLIHVGGYIGAWNTIAIVIITGITGAVLAREQGMSTLHRIQQDINNGLMPAEEIMEGIIILCGGLFFLTPGFITDILGFFMLIPITRKQIKKMLSRKIDRLIREGRIISWR